MTVLETTTAVHRRDKLSPGSSNRTIFLVLDFAAWERDSAARRLGDQAAAGEEPGAAQGPGQERGQESIFFHKLHMPIK